MHSQTKPPQHTSTTCPAPPRTLTLGLVTPPHHTQVLVATSTLAWGVNTPTHLVIIKGTEFYDAPSKRYVDFPITDVLQMMGRAGRPQFDRHGEEEEEECRKRKRRRSGGGGRGGGGVKEEEEEEWRRSGGGGR